MPTVNAIRASLCERPSISQRILQSLSVSDEHADSAAEVAHSNGADVDQQR